MTIIINTVIELAVITAIFALSTLSFHRVTRRILAKGSKWQATVIDVSPSEGVGKRKITYKYTDPSSGKLITKTIYVRQQQGKPQLTYLVVYQSGKAVTRTLPISTYKELAGLKLGDKLPVLTNNYPESVLRQQLESSISHPLYKSFILRVAWAIIIARHLLLFFPHK